MKPKVKYGMFLNVIKPKEEKTVYVDMKGKISPMNMKKLLNTSDKLFQNYSVNLSSYFTKWSKYAELIEVDMTVKTDEDTVDKLKNPLLTDNEDFDIFAGWDIEDKEVFIK